jgi:hypothetical protein
MPTKRTYHTFILSGVFAVAMGFLEAIVVVYLRKIYYPRGFDFPLQAVSSGMLSLELYREICTIVMLVIIALITGKNRLQKFAWFLYCFAIWDIFYYVGLKLFLNWPPSLLTWDILFLIPVPWVSPVLAPVICSLTMILLAACIVVLQAKGYDVHIKFIEWGLIIGGGMIIFISFIRDYSKIIVQEGLLEKILTLSEDQRFYQVMSQYQPVDFAWSLFIFGEILILFSVIMMVIRIKR